VLSIQITYNYLIMQNNFNQQCSLSPPIPTQLNAQACYFFRWFSYFSQSAMILAICAIFSEIYYITFEQKIEKKKAF